MLPNVGKLAEVQLNYETRFNCIICWSPKLRMVYGRCQHRACVDCLYESHGLLRSDLFRCPTCQQAPAFPLRRPDIPDDNIEIQRCLGVRECPNQDCGEEMWEWELEEHLSGCPKRAATPPLEKTTGRSSRKSLSAPSNPKTNQRVTRSRSQVESPEVPSVERRRSLRPRMSRVS